MTTPATDALATALPPDQLEHNARLAPSLLAPSPTNPRKRFDPARVQQIADSMRQVGQIQPIRARPNPQHHAGDGRPPFEIVVGETRWRAATLAQLPTLDVIVRAYSDMEALEVQLVENLQRADLHPMEEAEGYGQLLRSPTGLQGHASVHDMAARVGKSDSYVYQRMKLLALCPAGREAFYAGTITASVALLIARMPNAEEQARATARIVAGFGGEPYSYRQAVEYLQREFMLRLGLARFDITTTYAVAGPCQACNKRSGAEPDLFADVTAGDMCQDSRCYQAKTEEAHQALLQAARDAGRIVLQGAAARKVLPTPDATPVGHYRLDAPCSALTDSQRTLRELLGRGTTAQIVVVDLPDTTPVELVPEEAARKALKARSLLRAPPPAAAANASQGTKAGAPGGACRAAGTAQNAPPAGPPTAEGKGEKLDWWNDPKNDVKPRTVAADDAVDVEVLGRFGHLLADELQERLDEADELPLIVLRLALELLFEDMHFEEAELLYAIARWSIDDAVKAEGLDVNYKRHLAAADGRVLGELLALSLVVADCTSAMGPAMLRNAKTPAAALAAHFGIDLDRVMRDAQIAVRAHRRAGADESAAGAARRELDATAAFIEQHGAADGDAGSTQAHDGP